MNFKKFPIASVVLLFASSLILLSSCDGKKPDNEPNNGDNSNKIGALQFTLDGKVITDLSVKEAGQPARIQVKIENGEIKENLTWETENKTIAKVDAAGKDIAFISGLQQGKVNITCTAKIDGKEIKATLPVTVEQNPLNQYFIFDVDAPVGTEFIVKVSAKSGKATIFHGDNEADSYNVSASSSDNKPTAIKFKVNKEKKIKLQAEALFQVWLEEVPVTDMDVTHCKSMLYLYVMGGKLKTADVSSMPLLKECYLMDNELTSFKAGDDQVDLFYIQLDGNKLTNGSLDIPEKIRKIIRVLTLSRNEFTSFDLKPFPKLEEFKMSENKLTSIDASNMPKLWKMYAADNQITSIKTDNSRWLNAIRLQGNQLTDLGRTIEKTEDVKYFHQIMLENNKFTKEYLENLMSVLPDYNYYTGPGGKVNEVDKSIAEASWFSAYDNAGTPSEEAYKALEKKYWNVHRSKTTSKSKPVFTPGDHEHNVKDYNDAD